MLHNRVSEPKLDEPVRLAQSCFTHRTITITCEPVRFAGGFIPTS